MGSLGGDTGLARSLKFKLSPPGSAVFAGGSAGSVGEFAGLAPLVEDVACFSGTVVGCAFLRAGTGVEGTSPDARVNVIGESNTRIVVPSGLSLMKPVHNEAHVGSRENNSIGGAMGGSHGAPIVVTTLPSVDVLLPKPQVGHAKNTPFTLGHRLRRTPLPDVL